MNNSIITVTWTLICAFLVIFMQAGFAMMETGFTRAKNAGHTMAMNMMVFVIAVLGYWSAALLYRWAENGSSFPARPLMRRSSHSSSPQ